MGILGGLSVKELATRVWQQAKEDRCLNRAAELAFFFTMAIFPLLIFIISILSFVPGSSNMLLGYLEKLMPQEAMDVVNDWVHYVFSYRSKGLLSISLIFALWSASIGMAALIEVLNVPYEVGERRPLWKRWLVAIAMTISLSLLVTGGGVVVTFGDNIVAWMAGKLGIGGSFPIIWRAFIYLIGIAMLFIGMGLIYYFGPNVKHKWKQVMPGAIFAVVAFLGVSFLLSLYLRFAPSYNLIYGSLGAILVLMIWLYLMSLIILIGAEIHNEIEKAAGRAPVEKGKPKSA